MKKITELKFVDIKLWLINIIKIKKKRGMNTTQRINKKYKTFRVVAGRGTNALSFVYISQSESLIKRRKLKQEKTIGPQWSQLC